MLSRKRTGLLAGCVVAVGAAVYAAGQADTPAAKSPTEKQATAAETKAVEKAAAETPDAKPATSTTATKATEKTGKHAQEGTHLSKSDQRLLQWLVSDNQSEINLAQFVSTRANNAEVKQFAEKMIQDHTAFINKLAALNPDADLDRECADHVADKADKVEDRVSKFEEKSGKVQEKAAKASANAAENKDGDKTGNDKAEGAKADKNDKKSAKAEDKETKTARRVEKVEQKLDKAENKLAKADSKAAGCDLLAIKKEISERCFASVKRELEAKEGADFENCYLGQQIMAHMMMRDTLSVFVEHADTDDFKTVLREGVETAAAHLEKAQALMHHGATR